MRRIRKPGRMFPLLALLLLTACPGEDAPERRQAERGGTAVLLEIADMDKPMPIVWDGSLDSDLVSVMYMTLLRPWWEDGRLVYLTADQNPMALARSYEYVGPDSTAIRYHLRPDVAWSDGTPVTAHDVVWSYEVYEDPRAASPRQDYGEHIEEVVAEDDQTVLFRFHRRYPEMVFHANLAIAPRHVYEGHDPAQLRTHPQVTNPAGQMVVNGAYRIAQWERGQRVVLEPNPAFQPAPLLDRVVIRIVPEETTRMIEMQTGRGDMMRPLPFHQVDAIRGQRGMRIERQEKRAYDYIAYNPRAMEPLADPEIRRALGLAIDHQGLVSALQMDEWAVPAGGPYAPIFRDLYDPEAHAPLPFQPEEATRILQEAGWTPGPDGILVRDGQPFRFTLLTNAGNARRADAAQIIQQQLRRVGVEMRLQTLETNTFFDRLTRRDYQAALSGWNVALSPDIATLWGDPELPFNFVSYDNPTVQGLMEQALAQPDQERANRYWREAAGHIVADQPYTWLYYFDHLVAVSERLQGTRIDTLGAYQNLWEWWIPAEMQQGGATAMR